jgi:hypothetical protein
VLPLCRNSGIPALLSLSSYISTVGGSEFNPCASEGMLIIQRVSRALLWSELSEFYTECAAVAEPYQQDWILQSEVSLENIAAEHVAEQADERFAGVWLHEEMDAGTPAPRCRFPLLSSYSPTCSLRCSFGDCSGICQRRRPVCRLNASIP